MLITELNTIIDISLCKKIKNRTNPIIGIYKITSPTGKINIGQAIDIENRFNQYKNLSCKTQIKLYRSLKKYGLKNHKFEIIHICKEEELNYWELYYVRFFDTFNTPHGLNLRDGGGNTGKHSDETKKRIGNGNKKQFLSYEKSKKWINKNLKSITTQVKWKKITSELPFNIPKDPQISYKNKGWVGWGDFLGTGNNKGKFLSYEEAKKWVKENYLTKNIKSGKEWKKINKKLPYFITKDPLTYYRRQGVWKGWDDFLDTGIIRVSNQNISKYYYNYNDAKNWVNKNLLNIDTQDKWKKNTKNIPLFIPKSPQQYYSRIRCWISWNHFLENGRGYNFLSYDEAKKWIKKSKFKGIKLHEWKRQTSNLPSFIPKSPHSFYKKDGTWINWNDFINKK